MHSGFTDGENVADEQKELPMTTKKSATKQTKKSNKVLTVKSQLKAGITIVGNGTDER